jgi:Fur family iron response transcriptional regulator
MLCTPSADWGRGHFEQSLHNRYTRSLFDIPHAEVVVDKTPTPSEGYEVARIDVVVRLRRKSR